MLARIIDNTTILFDQITTPEENILIKEFSVQSPRARFIDTTEGNFDGWYRKYNARQRRMSRALLGDLRRVCRDYCLPLSVVDERPPPKYQPPDPAIVVPDLLPGIILEDYQVRCIQAVCRAEVGLIEVPTGGGKTELIAAITKIMDCPTVVIAEQKVVLTQLKERLELRQVAEEVGLFMAGKRPNGQMVIVGSIQSLMVPSQPPKKLKKDTPEIYSRKLKAYQTRRRNAYALRKMVNNCDLLLVDEADKAVNKQYNSLFKFWFKGRRRYGFSGTFFDPTKPVENLKLRDNLGSIIARATRSEVQARGRIIPVTYTAMAFGNPDGRKNKAAFDIAVREHIIENPKFHMLIKRLVELETAIDGHGAMVLTESIPLGMRLEEIIESSRFIYGNTSEEERNNVISQFERREIKVLIGSKIVKRGLDLNGGCEALFIAAGGKLWSEFNQMVGRAVRINKIGHSKIYDFYFLCNYYLYNHSRQRIKHIHGMGYPGRVIFPHGVVAVEDLINSRFRMPGLPRQK